MEERPAVGSEDRLHPEPRHPLAEGLHRGTLPLVEEAREQRHLVLRGQALEDLQGDPLRPLVRREGKHRLHPQDAHQSLPVTRVYTARVSARNRARVYRSR